MRRASTHLLLLLSLAACTEYGIVKDIDDPGEKPDSESTDTGDRIVGKEGAACDDPDVSRGGVGVDESCIIEAHPGTFTPVIEWSVNIPDGVYTTPVVGNLSDDNGDGVVDERDVPDIVVASIGGTFYVLSGDDGHLLWSYASGSSEPSSCAIGELDNRSGPEVVCDGVTGVYAFHHEGTLYWHSMPAGLGNLPTCGGVAIYDLDGDSNPEVVHGHLILNGQNGTLRGAGAHGQGSGYGSGWGSTVAAFGVAADVNQDGMLDVVVGNALYDADGRTIWTNGQSDGYVAVANFDADEYGEIVVSWTGNVRLQDHDGTVLWSNNYTGSTIGPPTVADFDGDGQPEIGVAGQNTYIVIERDGTLKWRNTTTDYSSGFTGSSVFDFEGDGQAEVVYADENEVWVYDGATGAVKMSETRHSSATCSEYPTIADVDNDGHAEIIYTSSPYSGSESGVTVIGDADNSWVGGRPIWNQHSYSITNVNADATIPTSPDTNWLSYNNFRSGDLAALTGGALTDALPELVEICLDDCDKDMIRLVIRVGNSGVETLPAGVAVSVYVLDASDRAHFLIWRETTEPIPSGSTSAGLMFDLNPADVPTGRLRVIVDDENGEERIGECHEDNNVLDIDGLECP